MKTILLTRKENDNSDGMHICVPLKKIMCVVDETYEGNRTTRVRLKKVSFPVKESAYEINKMIEDLKKK